MSASSPDKEELLDQLAEEYADRFRRGERPELEEYADRYPQLAEEIRELFPALVAMERAREDPDQATEPSLARATPALEQVGDYRIVREVGRGGMGVVYEAEQVSLGRRVALKVLPLNASQDAQVLARFQREARAAAKLHHTNIVPVFEVGQDGATWYYAMQFIPGQGLDQVIEEVRRFGSASLPSADPEDAARPPAPGSSGRQLAQSLITGHFQPQEPAPVTPPPGLADPPSGPAAASLSSLSGAQSGHRHYFASVARIGRQAAQALAYAHARGIIHRDIKPSNLLLDVAGVVWVTDFGLAKTEDDGLTRTGDIVGTLRYLAPERFRGECDVRADVYALGLTLYELLVLRPAFPARDRLGVIDQIKGEEPPRPRSVDRRIPRDLETIILKAIEKDPKRRYPSADDLAEDLRRFLADEPVQARRASRTERLARWARRNKSLAASLAVIAVLLLAAALASTAGLFLLRAANEGEHAARLEAEDQRDEIRYHLYVANMGLAQREWVNGNAAHVRELLDACAPRKPGDKDLRGWEWYYLDRLRHSNLRILAGHVGDVNCVIYRPDGAELASGGDDGTVRLWDVATGRQSRVLTGHTRDVLAVAYSPDGKRLASTGRDGTVRLWNLTVPGTARVLARLRQKVSGLAFSPDAKWLAAAGDDRVLRLWDLAAGGEPRVFTGHQNSIEDLAIRPDGTVRVWDVTGKQPPQTLTGHVGKVCSVAYSPDGSWLASAGDDATVRVWDLTAGMQVRFLKGHAARVQSLAFCPDGIHLASASIDGTVRVWDAVAGKELRVLRGHTGEVNRVAYSPDGTQLASAGDDETVRVWDAGAVEGPRVLRGHTDVISAVAFRPDAARLVSSSYDGTVRVWHVLETRELRTLRADAAGVKTVAYIPDGSRLMSVGRRGEGRLWDAATGRVLRTFPGPQHQAHSATVSADGRWLAIGASDNTVWVMGVGGETRVFKGHSDRIDGLVFHPDGSRLASGSRDETVRIWDLAGTAPPLVLPNPRRGITCVAYNPTGAWLVSGDHSGMIRVWDVAAGKEVCTLKGHTGRVVSLAFNRDGSRLASGGHDGTVRVWDPARGAELGVLTNHVLDVASVAFSPDGTRLASGGADRTICIVDARPWTARSPDEQEALGLVGSLFARPLRQVDVVRRLRGHKGISEPVRQRALELAARIPDFPARFHQASAHVARYPDLSTSLYQQALDWAQTAWRLAPGTPDYLTTRGIAQYRLGRYAEAVGTLQQSDKLRIAAQPADLAFLAMAHHRLGHSAEARAALNRLRELMKASFAGASEEALAFRAEAENLMVRRTWRRFGEPRGEREAVTMAAPDSGNDEKKDLPRATAPPEPAIGFRWLYPRGYSIIKRKGPP